MDLLGQRDINFEDTPRYGCYVMCCIAIPQLVHSYRLSEQHVVNVIKEAQKTPRWPGQDPAKAKMVIGQDPKLPACKKYVWNPGKLVDMAFEYMYHLGAEELHGYQVRDESEWYSWADPSKHFLSFKVLQVQRPRGFHYRLADAAGVALYNPIPGMDFPLTGHWIGFAVGDPR